MKSHFYIVLLLCFFLSACDNSPGARHAKFYAFGTEINVSLYGVEEQTAIHSVDSLQQSFDRSNDLWHAWQPSTLTKINTAIAEGEAIHVGDEVADVIILAQSLAEQSQQLFNPAAGQLFELWGFHQVDWFTSRPPPERKLIQAWLEHSPSMADIEINDGLLTSLKPNVKLGFGGFAKGFAVDAAISQLQQQGISNAMVNIGGDLRAIGQHGERPWNIGIRHPRQNGMIASIAIKGNESVFTSGDYERFFEYQGHRYPHILDPRTGYPADKAISVTVLHSDASTADAAATALFVAGANWPVIAQSMGVDHVMLVTTHGQIYLSAKMHERINILDETAPIHIRVIEPQTLN